MNHSSAILCIITSCLLPMMLCGQEAKPAKKQATSMEELSATERSELRFALRGAAQPSENRTAEAVLTKYAPLDQPGIFEAHEALVNLDFKRRQNRGRSTMPYVPDFDFLDKHLQHMRTLRPDSSVVELTEKKYEYETRYHYYQGLNKSFQVAFNAWNADPLEVKPLLYYFEKVSLKDQRVYILKQMESKLERSVRDALEESEVDLVVAKRGSKIVISPRRKKLMDSLLAYFDKHNHEKGIRLLEDLKTHPNYPGCEPLIEKLKLKKLKTLAEVGSLETAEVGVLVYSDKPEQREAQLRYLESVYMQSHHRRYSSVNKLLVDLIFAGGEYGARAREISDPTQITDAKDFNRIGSKLRAYIARKFFEQGDYDQVLLWGIPTVPGKSQTLGIWCIAHLKSEKGEPAKALDAIKHEQMETDELLKAKGMLLVENGYPLLAVDLLKFYCNKFPDDEDAKEYLAKCNASIRSDVK